MTTACLSGRDMVKIRNKHNKKNRYGSPEDEKEYIYISKMVNTRQPNTKHYLDFQKIQIQKICTNLN